MKKQINFGIIGCGLMGREFASAAARWRHLAGELPEPRIVAVCNRSPAAMDWFSDNIPSVVFRTTDYRELLARSDVEAVYCAVPHDQHERIYCDAIAAGKHLLGEKPFGIDFAANARILSAARARPELLVRCASEFPYFPACQQLVKWIREKRFGRIIEVRAGFLHSSDMDVRKPINWKRMARYNGEYGCMGDLGIHVEHVPFSVGWTPRDVYATLSNIVAERPDRDGSMVDCDTWDNASLVCRTSSADGDEFPMFLETKRIAPGATNEWYIEVRGMERSARFTTSDPNAFYYTESWGKNQAWCRIDVGYTPLFGTITGEIFQFGFTDAILQMWAAYIAELDGRDPGFRCFTPEQTALSHRLQTAALLSDRERRSVRLDEIKETEV